jgi:transcription elongation factor GreA
MPETWLSQEAYDRLKAELDDLTTTGRERMAQEIEVARAHGDLRENAEYHAAKDAQGQMEARIRQLEALLRDARIGQPDTTDAVRPGLVVTLEIDGDHETWMVGSREDSHPDHPVLSAESPMGKAILDQPAGTTVTVNTPGGELAVTVVSIEPV